MKRMPVTNEYAPADHPLLDKCWDCVFSCVLSFSNEGESFEIELIVEVDGGSP